MGFDNVVLPLSISIEKNVVLDPGGFASGFNVHEIYSNPFSSSITECQDEIKTDSGGGIFIS